MSEAHKLNLIPVNEGESSRPLISDDESSVFDFELAKSLALKEVDEQIELKQAKDNNKRDQIYDLER